MSAADCVFTLDDPKEEIARLNKVIAELRAQKDDAINTLTEKWVEATDEKDAMHTQLIRYMGLEPECKRLTEENTALRRELDQITNVDLVVHNTNLEQEIVDLRKDNQAMSYSLNQLKKNQVYKINGKFGCWSCNQRSKLHFRELIQAADRAGWLDDPILPGEGFSLRTVKPEFLERYKVQFKCNMHLWYKRKNDNYNVRKNTESYTEFKFTD